MTHPMAGDSEFQALNAFSAALGRDSDRTQAAGGNTSLKRDGTLWIKASGTWLAHALESDIMVPVVLSALMAALKAGDTRAETAVAFVDQSRNAHSLRPSVETSVHAVIPHAVVAHIHCVETLAHAVQPGSEAEIARRLGALADVSWLFIPYVQPGVPLSVAIAEASTPATNVLILGNHGLVVSGSSVAEVEERLNRVRRALALPPRSAPSPDIAALEASIAGTDYRLPAYEAAHGVALDPISATHARGGSLYPDHVVFLGPGVIETANIAAGAAIRKPEAKEGPPPMLVLPGLGVVLHRSTTPASDALALCLWDVTSRIPAGAKVRRLTPAQDYQLTHWEAERYRQAIDAKLKAS